MKLDQLRRAVAPACREFRVKRLAAFGSVARGTSTHTSDVDLVVEFDEPLPNPAKAFFGFLHHVEDALGCEVDLLTLRSIRNPYFRKRIMEERVPLYEG